VVTEEQGGVKESQPVTDVTLHSILDAMSDLAAWGDRHVALATHGVAVSSPSATVGAHQLPGDGQAQAGSARGAVPRRIRAVEPVEDVGQVRRRD